MHCTHPRIAPFGNAKMCIDCLEVFADDEEGTEDPTEPWGSIDTDAVVKISGGLFQNLCEIAAAAEGAMEWRSDEIVVHSGMGAPVPLRFYVEKGDKVS
jgi:hypothetical protein